MDTKKIFVKLIYSALYTLFILKNYLFVYEEFYKSVDKRQSQKNGQRM